MLMALYNASQGMQSAEQSLTQCHNRELKPCIINKKNAAGWRNERQQLAHVKGACVRTHRKRASGLLPPLYLNVLFIIALRPFTNDTLRHRRLLCFCSPAENEIYSRFWRVRCGLREGERANNACSFTTISRCGIIECILD